MPNYNCFISYKSEDRPLAEQVHDRLVAAGFAPIWFDRKRLQPGFAWDREIEEGCESSRVILPILTPRWSSEWTRFETYGAETVIPLRFEGVFTEVAPGPLLRFQAHEINFADGAQEQDWEKLFTALRELLARPPPDKQARLARLRYLPNPHFVGRERELLEIHEHFHGNPTTTLTQGRVHAIAAMGGVGKTTLARQYAEKFWRCYSQMLWVDARQGLEAEFAALYRSLHPEANPELKDAQCAALMLDELNSRTERLLIIDNAEDEQSVQRWIPKLGGCRTLITSRFAGWSAGIGRTHIYVLEPKPARELLLRRAGIKEPSGDDIDV